MRRKLISRSTKGTVAIGGALLISLSLAVAGFAAKRVQHVGVSPEVETSVVKGTKKVTVTGVLESSLARCERQRSVLLYEANSSGDISGAAIGHGVSEGGADRGQFEVTGKASKQIRSDRRFILEAVGRRVKVKGQEKICKRGVSVEFPGNFNPPTS